MLINVYIMLGGIVAVVILAMVLIFATLAAKRSKEIEIKALKDEIERNSIISHGNILWLDMISKLPNAEDIRKKIQQYVDKNR